MPYPKQREIVLLDFDPSRGKEIKKRRPALVISRNECNQYTGFCLVCPITSTIRPYPTYVDIKSPKNITGQIVTHQIRSINYQHRNLQVVETCNILTWTDVLSIIQNFI